MNLDLAAVVRATAGKPLPERGGGVVTGISTDTRTLQQGDLFVPLRGENFDGHAFLQKAAEAGAAACLSEIEAPGLPIPLIQVPDTLRALGDLAAEFRRRFAGPVCAVTGSSGKTTTKEMLAAILALTGPGLKTEGNFNNLIGLPHTLFRLQPEHQWLVLEMGMSSRGEIARLAEIAVPQIGIITNVGPAHLETLHGLEGVARAKGELFAALPPGGTAVINSDDERVAAIPVANGARRLLFGTRPGVEIRAEAIRAAGEGIAFTLVTPSGRFAVRLSIPGRHNVHNALAAAAAATALRIEGETIVRGLESFRSGRGRMDVVHLPGSITVLEDFYNANPLSVRAALIALDEMGGAGRRIAVLGDMLELGAESARLHREVGAEAARRCDFLIVLGEMAKEIAAGAAAEQMPAERISVTASHGDAGVLLDRILQPGDRLLIKGSRGMKMEKICAVLRENPKQPATPGPRD